MAGSRTARRARVIRLVVASAICFLLIGTTIVPAPDGRTQQLLAETPPDRLNVVLVMVDDLKRVSGFLSEEPGNFLSQIYPDPAVRAAVRQRLTPNLNEFASTSTVFSRAYAVSPVCNPSRTAMLTGLLPSESGVTTNAIHFRDTIGDQATTLPQNFKQQGYYTAGVGKIFHQSQPSPTGVDWPDEAKSWSVWANRGVGSTGGRTYSPFGTAGTRFGSVPSGVETFSDYRNAGHIADALNGSPSSTISLDGSSPFFLAYGGYLPHQPMIAPASLLAEFPAAEIHIDAASIDAIEADLGDLPNEAIKWTVANGPFERILANGESQIGGSAGEIAAYKELVRHYLAAVAVADRSLGQILDAVETGGHADNTVVVVAGDHGYDLGEKSHVGKYNLWEESAGTPLMIKVPGATASQVDTPVSLFDVYPTLTSLAELELPANVRGNDLSSLIDGTAQDWDEPVLSIVRDSVDHYAVRNEQYSFLSWEGRTQFELYDWVADPDELTNLANDPSHASALVEMNSILDDMLATVGPPPPPTTTTTTTTTSTTTITLPITTTTVPTTTSAPTTTSESTTTSAPTSTTDGGLPQVSVIGTSVTEGESNISFPVELRLDRPAPSNVRVFYRTDSGTADRNADYQYRSSSVLFRTGETGKTIQLTVRGDTRIEGDEEFYVSLTRSSGAAVILGDRAAIVIIDNESPPTTTTPQLTTTTTIQPTTTSTQPTTTTSQPTTTATQPTTTQPATTTTAPAPPATPTVSLGSVVVTETESNNRITVEVVLDEPLSDQLRVYVSTQAVTARRNSDYQHRSTAVVFSPGQTVAPLSILIRGDSTPEPTESFLVRATRTVGPDVDLGHAATIVIVDND